MIRHVILLTATITLASCSSPKVKSLSPEQLQQQAEAYASKYRDIPFAFPPVIINLIDGQMTEVIYIDLRNKRIGHDVYNTPPTAQFLELLKKNSQISYLESKTQIKHRLHNYFAEDCPNITGALMRIKKMDLRYKREVPYSFNPNNENYSYLYIDEQSGYTPNQVTAAIAEHPVSEIYRIATKAINECPHPKVPKYFKQQ